MGSDEMNEYIHCFACGARSLNIEGETHPYMLSAPGCYAMFLEVAEKEYSDLLYARAHHYTVDCYACQHPGKPDDRRAVNSVAIHLVSLYMVLEKGVPLAEAARVKMEFSQYNKANRIVTHLEPPSSLGNITIFDVWDADDRAGHFASCEEWAWSVWRAWEAHHETIRKWAEVALKNGKFGF